MSGKSIASVGGLDSIRPLMGVCPQFDTSLCALLTGKEHLQLFARIKGVPPSLRSQEVNQLLEEVKVNAKKILCEQLSCESQCRLTSHLLHTVIGSCRCDGRCI